MHGRIMKRAEYQEMSTKAKKKRQQRAQSRLALARSKQQDRARRLATAAQRAESRWHKTSWQLAVLGAALQEDEKFTDGNDHPEYVVGFEGNVSLFHSRFQVQRWLKRTQRRLEEEQMSYDELHVRWMIENNCDDHGNPWPE
jgi:hypothetical protein